MTIPSLATRCDEAAQAVARIARLPDVSGLSPEAVALSAALVLSIHGGLFAECAVALREGEEGR